MGVNWENQAVADSAGIIFWLTKILFSLSREVFGSFGSIASQDFGILN